LRTSLAKPRWNLPIRQGWKRNEASTLKCLSLPQRALMSQVGRRKVLKGVQCIQACEALNSAPVHLFDRERVDGHEARGNKPSNGLFCGNVGHRQGGQPRHRSVHAPESEARRRTADLEDDANLTEHDGYSSGPANIAVN
jgi:hypothetical protein